MWDWLLSLLLPEQRIIDMCFHKNKNCDYRECDRRATYDIANNAEAYNLGDIHHRCQKHQNKN